MTTTEPPWPPTSAWPNCNLPASPTERPSWPCSAAYFHVLAKSWLLFIIRALVQPVMLMFIFTYVFPKIGQGVGGKAGADQFTTVLVAGVIGLAIIFQGIQAVALPLVQEFGYSKEIEDRVLARGRCLPRPSASRRSSQACCRA